MNLRTDDLSLLLDPADPLAADCIATRAAIRQAFERAKRIARTWEPRPMPRKEQR